MSVEVIVRTASFVLCLLVFGYLERRWPRRAMTQTRLPRWLANLGVVAINNAVVRVALPVLPLGLAVWAQGRGVGLFNLLNWPQWLEILLTIALLDMIVYWQHVAFHIIPPLWALHMSHHTDLDLDLTSGIRFHPVEILISALIKIMAVLALGAAPLAVIIFEILLNATAMFNHANWKIPLHIDRWLRLFLVTPDMHRVHHSVRMVENKSNYGFNLPWWDRLFGSYIAQPVDGHDGMIIGLSRFRKSRFGHLDWLLALPFSRDGWRFARQTAPKDRFRLN